MRATMIFVVVLTTLHLIGAFAPNIFTWGVHFLGFLPKSMLLLYVFLIVVGCAYIFKGSGEQHVIRISQLFALKPATFLVITCIMFVVCAVLLRVEVPLLGDSFIAVKIFSKSIQGAQILPPSHQSLALHYFYLFLKLSGTFNYPEMMNAFLIGELLLGIGFIVIVYFTTKNIFENPTYRCLSFLLLMVLPYMELFFGYVELYAVILFLLSMYVLVTTLYLQDKIPFAVTPVVFTLLLLSHYLNALLLPSLFYLGFLEYRRRRWKHIGISVAVLAILVIVGLTLMNFNIEKLIPPNRGVPLLTIAPSESQFQAYTLFSPYHFSDLLNLAVLLSPSALFMLVMTFTRHRSVLLSSPTSRFFMITSAPIVVFVLAARFDIPMAQDWDVPASYAYLLTLYALLVAGSWMAEHHIKILGTVVLMTFLNSLVWFLLNSTVEPNLDRVQQFIDKRISSHDGIYQSTHHVGEYFLHVNDKERLIQTYERFIAVYPTDKRGYSNYTLYLMQFGKSLDATIISIFDSWLALDSTNSDARIQYANFYLDIGNRSYREGLFHEAIDHYAKAIALTPNFPDAYNGLGVAYRNIGNLDSARLCYQKTIELDSASVYGYINLGNLYDDAGNVELAIASYEKALELEPNAPQLHFNIGVTHYKQGNIEKAVESLQQAARLGDTDAQAFLREHNETW